jgi:hypothetical protein
MTHRPCLATALALLLTACAAAPSAESSYGPLSFNQAGGADFYFAQGGQFAPARLSQGTIEVDLKPAPFQIGYDGEQLNICLAQAPGPEIRTDPQGYKASCLAGPMSGAHAPDALLVYSGRKWSDGNTEFSDSVSKKTEPLPGYRLAYEVDELTFIDAPDSTLQEFRGTLYGYIVVYKQHTRMNRDIMPIRLVFK